MITLVATAKFIVYDFMAETTTHYHQTSKQLSQSNSSLSFSDFLSKYLKEYHKYVPDDMDWDIYEACAISVKEQRDLTEARLASGVNSSNSDARSRHSDGLVPVFTYGEIDFACIARVLYDLKVHCALPGGGSFYDLGSGTGKVVLAAALLHNFSSCRGVELLRGLHEVALGYKQAWDRAAESAVLNPRPSVEYALGSILEPRQLKSDHSSDTDCGCEFNWPKDGDVVFANTHCFDPDMMMVLSTLAGGMKPGSYFICTTVKLDEETSGGFRTVREFKAEMSWGVANGYIMQKPPLSAA